MEIGPLLSDLKWDIIKALSRREKSPLELSKMLNSSISNVSQQLKLLEFSGIINKTKVSNNEKGKPRSLYSLGNNYAYLVTLMKGTAEKQLLTLNDRQKYIIKTWLLPDHELHYFVEKFYWKLEPHLENITALAFSFNKEITAHIVSDQSIPAALKELTLSHPKGSKKTFKSKKTTIEDLRTKDVHVFYDPQNMLTIMQKRGGGEQ